MVDLSRHGEIMIDNAQNQSNPVPLATVAFPTTEGMEHIQLDPGQVVYIIGKNGTGKSALAHHFSRIKHVNVLYLPGTRSSHFDSEFLTLTPASRQNLVTNVRTWDDSETTRWKLQAGPARNERAIFDLQSEEITFQLSAAHHIKVSDNPEAAITKLRSGTSPLDRVNVILKQAGLPIQLEISNAQLVAYRSNSTFSIAKMSDGERSSVIMAAEVIAAPARTLFVFDEPELHLHKAIVGPLITALISERSDCCFIITTHELDLRLAHDGSIIVLCRDAIWQGNVIHHWDVDVFFGSGELPESLFVDVLGSRRKILFIEGTDSSLDYPLYSLLFPNISVRSRESCRSVREAVAGLRADAKLHRVEAFGLIDNDGSRQSNELEDQGIFTTTVFAVESLYYASEVLEAIATAQGEMLGMDATSLIEKASSDALSVMSASVISRLASRVAERQIRDSVLQQMPNHEQLVEGDQTLKIEFNSPYHEELNKLTELVQKKDLDGIISNYPVRESGILTQLARGFRFTSRRDYEAAVLTRIARDGRLRNAIKQRLGTIALKLN